MAQTLTFANLEKIIEKNNTTIKEWVNTQITDTSTFSITWVEELPTENISTSTIYMVKNTESTEENNIYDEYAYNETSGWEVLGSLNTGSIDLSDYYNKTQTYNKEEVDTLFTDVNTDIETLTSKVNEIKLYQKYVNTDMEYCLCYGEKSTTYTDSQLPYNVVSILTNRYTNMEIDNEGYILLKANKKYIISFDYAIYGGNDVNVSIIDKDKNLIETVSSWKHPSSNSNGNPLTGFVSFSKDTYIGANFNQTNSNTFYGNHIHILIQEIGRQTIIDPIEHANEKYGIEDTPVGHIISHMGTVAPKHYLICDGTEYNIMDYPYLAQHFIDQFGSVNYFGGDGSTTFAVPDLRGEFLRGTGENSRENQGSGANVGEHQDATQHINFRVGSTGGIVAQGLSYTTINEETKISTSTKEYWSKNDSSASANTYQYYTSRPTNTSVLYCIKYEPTYFMVNKNTNYLMPNLYSEEERVVGCWTDGKPLYQKTFTYKGEFNTDTNFTTSGLENSEMYQIRNGYLKHGSTVLDCCNYSPTDSNYHVTCFIRNTDKAICLRMGSAYTSSPFYTLVVTLQYTKTTDEENSFTTDMIKDFTTQTETIEEYPEEDVTNAINELW